MGRTLIIEGNAVYEIDEECRLKKRLTQEEVEKGMNEDNPDTTVVHHTASIMPSTSVSLASTSTSAVSRT